jgi:hypothetical protein
MHVGVVARHEASTAAVTTLVSGPKTVLFSNQYTGLTNAQVTPMGTVSRTAAVDRILVNPNASGCMQYDSHITGAGGYEIRTIFNSARAILTDDYLEYDVLIPNNSPIAGDIGSFDIYNAAITQSAATRGCVDQNGDAPNNFRSQTFGNGAWYSRKISLHPMFLAGDTTGNFTVVDNSNLVADHIALYKNIRITNGAGTDRLVIYAGPGEPARGNAPGDLAFSSNSAPGQVGQANAMDIYLFTSSTGAQVAGDVTWNVSGV